MTEREAPKWAIGQAERVAGIDGQKRHVLLTNGVISIFTHAYVVKQKLGDYILYTTKAGE